MRILFLYAINHLIILRFKKKNVSLQRIFQRQ